MEDCEIGVVFSTEWNEEEWEQLVPKSFVHTRCFNEIIHACLKRQQRFRQLNHSWDGAQLCIIVDEELKWRPQLSDEEMRQENLIVVISDAKTFKGQKLFKRDWEFAYPPDFPLFSRNKDVAESNNSS